MIDGSPNQAVSGFETSRLARVQNDLDLAFDDEIVVEGHAAVHPRSVSGRKIDSSRGRAVGDEDARPVLDKVFVHFDVPLAADVNRKSLSGVTEGDLHVVRVGSCRRPLVHGRLKDGFSHLSCCSR